MNGNQVTKRVLIAVVLLAAVLQLGGATVFAGLDRQPSWTDIESAQQGLAERFCREIGFPRSDLETCRLLMRVFG